MTTTHSSFPHPPETGPGVPQRPTEAQISDLVDRFYARVREDDQIGPIFNEHVENWPAHLALLKEFWSTVLLGTGTYKGNPMLAHFPLRPDPQAFLRWLALFEQTAREVMPPAAAANVIARAQTIATNMRRVLAEAK